MNTMIAKIVALSLALGAGVLQAADLTDSGFVDIASLPAMDANYKAEPYIEAAAILQKLGKQAAYERLFIAAKKNHESEQVIVLCRMLFSRSGAGEFRAPMIGAMHFLGATDQADWPLGPIAVEAGIPFLVGGVVAIAGHPESADAYLTYCMDHCSWNAFQYHTISFGKRREALTAFVASKKWRRPLNAEERQVLSVQIE